MITGQTSKSNMSFFQTRQNGDDEQEWGAGTWSARGAAGCAINIMGDVCPKLGDICPK